MHPRLERHFSCLKVKNFWVQGGKASSGVKTDYMGINSQWGVGDAGVEFELQFSRMLNAGGP